MYAIRRRGWQFREIQMTSLKFRQSSETSTLEAFFRASGLERHHDDVLRVNNESQLPVAGCINGWTESVQ